MDGVGAGTFGKPLLVELSHMIEQFALAVEPGVPMVVVAMFQKLAYFSREAQVYREIAARGAVTVVGLVEHTPPELPPGVRHVLVPAVDDLEREWSVTALTPTGGATLVASDLETLDPAAPTLERGRTFRAGWSFRREEARAQVHRLRAKLGLDPATAARLDLVLDAVALSPHRGQEAAWERSLQFLTARMDDAIRTRATAAARLAVLEEGDGCDPHTGFYNPASLDRWIGGSAAGTLPIGLVLLRLPGLATLRPRYGRRGELAVLQGLAAVLHGLTGAAGRVVALGPEEILAVLPSATPDDVLALCHEACRHTVAAQDAYPYVVLPALVAGTITRARPLPLDRLRRHVAPAREVALVPS
jgi:GGDEF domain-containing protein